MIIIFIIFGIISLMYVLLIFCFYIGWRKIPFYRINSYSRTVNISVIISVRNEQEVITNLLDDLVLQNYSKDRLQIIIVNDHSGDNTENIVEEYIREVKNIRLINLQNNKFGKKNAIIEGVNLAKGELIITTDADCRVSCNWVAAIAEFYKTEKPKMIISPVVMNENKSFFQKAQSLEFMSLIGAGAGATGVKHPFICNGANLAFEKNVFVDNMLENKHVSGDDVFLLHNLKKENRNKIMFLKNSDAIVSTTCLNTLNEFFNQRVRWTSKSKLYFDVDSIVVSLIVFLVNCVLLLNIILSFIYIEFLYSFLIIFLIKTVIDILIFIPVTKFFKKQKLLLFIIPVQFIYIFYVTFIAIISSFIKYTWKDRQY